MKTTKLGNIFGWIIFIAFAFLLAIAIINNNTWFIH